MTLDRRRFVAAMLGAATGTAHGQERFPSKPLRLIVPFAPGGANDTVGRLFAQKLPDHLGQPVVVENRAGAGGTIAAQFVAKAPADGHTVLVADLGPNAIAGSLFPNLGYDPARDFAAVSLAGRLPLVLLAHPSLAASNQAELVRLARARPGSVTYGSPGGGGSLGHIAMEMYAAMSGVTLLHVPYKGSAPAMQAVMAGEVQLTPSSITSALPFIQSGRLKPIAQMGARRSALLPNLPTFVEAGLPDYVVENWVGFVVPAGTPRHALDTLAKAFAAIAQADDVHTRLVQSGFEVVGSTPEEFNRFLLAEIDKFGRVVRSAGIKPEQ